VSLNAIEVPQLDAEEMDHAGQAERSSEGQQDIEDRVALLEQPEEGGLALSVGRSGFSNAGERSVRTRRWWYRVDVSSSGSGQVAEAGCLHVIGRNVVEDRCGDNC
jgi:hypothetical protein